MALPEPELFDVTYFSLKVASVKVQLHTDFCSLELVTSSIDLNFNDLANERYSKRVSLNIPLGRLAILGQAQEKSLDPPVLAAFKTSIMVTNFVQKRGFDHFHQSQQEHIALHDSPFGRCPFLLHKEFRDLHQQYDHTEYGDTLEPSISLPKVPPQLNSETIHIIDPNANSSIAAGLSPSEYSSSSSSMASNSSRSRTGLSSVSSISHQPEENSNPATTHLPESIRLGNLHKQQSSYQSTATEMTDRGENSYLPPQKWQTFEKLSQEFQTKDSNFHLHPTVHYSDHEPLAPRTTLDDDIMYDNFIVQLGPLEGYVGPRALGAAESIILTTQKNDTEDTLDVLQVEVLKKIKYINFGKPESLSLRLLVPTVSLKYGSVLETAGIHSLQENEQSHIFVDCRDMNIALRLFREKQPQSIGDYMRGEEEPLRKIIYLDLENITIGVRRGQQELYGKVSENYNPLVLQMENMEFWYHDDESNVGSLRIKSIDSAMVGNQAEWLSSYLDQTISQARDLNVNQGLSFVNSQDRCAYMVYELAMAGERYGIQHDPSVLTKPAYIIRSPQHLRATTSWKILVRLRHLYMNVPSKFRDELNQNVVNNSWNLPGDIKSRVIDIFMKWRSWELSNIPDSYFFKHAFIEVSLKEAIIKTSTRTLLDVESIGLRLQYSEEEDFIIFDYIRMLFSWNRSSDSDTPDHGEPSLDVDSTIACSNIRTRVSYNILEVYDSINSFISIPRNSAAVVEQSTDKPNSGTSFPMLNVNSTILVNTVSTVLGLPTVELHFDSQEFRLTSLYKHLSPVKAQHVGVSAVTELDYVKIELREQDTVLSHMASNLSGSLNFTGQLKSCPKYIMLNIYQSRFKLDYDFEQLTDLSSRLIDKDYQIVAKHFSTDGKNSNEKWLKQTEIHTMDDEPFYIGPVFLKVEQTSGSAEFNVMPSLYLNYHIGMVRAGFRQVDETSCCGQVQFKNQRLEIRSDNTNRAKKLSVLSIDDIESLGRVEFANSPEGLNIAELFVNVHSIETLLDSAPELVYHLMSKELQQDIYSISKNVRDLSKKVNSAVHADSEEKSNGISCIRNNSDDIKPNCALNLNMNVQRSIVLASIDNHSVALDSSNFSLQCRSFELSHDGTVKKQPLNGYITSGEFKVMLVGQELANNHFQLLSLQATAAYQERSDVGNKDRINFTSDFLHTQLDKDASRMILKIANTLQNKLVIPAWGDQTKSENKNEPEEMGKSSEVFPYGKVFKKFADRSISTLQLNNVAFAWLYDSSTSGSAGILLGYEAFEVSTTSFKARANLSGVYLTPAVSETIFLNGKTCDGESANTAYLPNIELMIRYLVSGDNSKSPALNLRLIGDSLKITLLPSVVRIVSESADSIIKTIGALEGLIPESPVGQTDESSALNKISSHGSDSSSNSSPLRLPLSFDLTVMFEAAVINVWDEIEYYHNSQLKSDAGETPQAFSPALFLQTPSVRTKVTYRIEEKSKGSFNTEIFITSSSNTIYPKAVPVAVHIYNSIREVIRMSHNRKQKQNQNQNQKRRRGSSLERRLSIGSNSSNAKGGANSQPSSQLFNGLDVFVSVRFARQEITLSCVPTAKVAATLSHDQSEITVNTTDSGNGRYFCGTARLQNLRVSLQHIYSREVSGLVSLENLTIFGCRHNSQHVEPVKIAGQLSDVTVDIILKQMQDLELFLDIWRPSGSLTATTPGIDRSKGFETGSKKSELDVPEDSEEKELELTFDGASPENEGGLVLKYRRATTTVAIPWSIDFSITNVKGVIDMGQSIGELSIGLDRFWLSSQKSSNWEQNMMAGFDMIELTSEGRLAGLIRIKKLQMKTAIKWEDIEKYNEDIAVPLVQAVVGFDSFEARMALDFHLFSVVYVKALKFSMSNQHDAKRILGDRLLVIGDCDVFNIYLTGLAASNVLDIYYTVIRMRKESHASYDAILKDSSSRPSSSRDPDPSSSSTRTKDEKSKRKQHDSTLSNVIAKLRTVLDIKIASCSLLIFPNSMLDSVVFTLAINGANASYGQEQQHNVVESNLDMKMDFFTVALATMRRPCPQEDVNKLSVPDFVDYATEAARGGTIIYIPEFIISMNTWQECGKSVVEYTYNSSFGGRVEVGWNLGAVNFIREMWETHARAYTTRREAYAMKASQNVLGKMNLDENLKDVTLNTEYSYVARSPPVIATPQLRDMGEATPPIEWIGLHRQRFPGLTHQVIIVGLQSLVHDVELLYRQVLGHS